MDAKGTGMKNMGGYRVITGIGKDRRIRERSDGGGNLVRRSGASLANAGRGISPKDLETCDFTSTYKMSVVLFQSP